MARMSRIVRGMESSASASASKRAADLRARGFDVISFARGEPDFFTPKHIREAAKSAIDEGASHYTAVGGMVDLKKAISSKYDWYNLGPKDSQVVVCSGAKHALFNVAMAIYDAGDKVIIPAPYWVSYPEQARLCGAEPRIIRTNQKAWGFRLSSIVGRRAGI